MLTIEAELCKTLNISWADARDLASYARGKLGIIPGDKVAEQTHRQSILTAAIAAIMITTANYEHIKLLTALSTLSTANLLQRLSSMLSQDMYSSLNPILQQYVQYNYNIFPIQYSSASETALSVKRPLPVKIKRHSIARVNSQKQESILRVNSSL
jgi:hypothetical protein